MRNLKLIPFLLVFLTAHSSVQKYNSLTIDDKSVSTNEYGDDDYDDDHDDDQNIPNEDKNISDGFNWDNLVCEDVSSVPLNNQCQFISSKCQDHQLGLLDYYKLYYCTSESQVIKKLIITPLVTSILIVLFIWLGLTASEYLCPNLSSISNYLGIPENISGLTLLAFGNGSPDIMSTYSSFQTSNASLAVGELIGAAFFITSFIIGTIVVVQPFSLISEKLPTLNNDTDDSTAYNLLIYNDKAVYIRDLVFFLLSILLTMLFLRDGQLTKPRLIALVSVYIIYVIVVSVWQWLVLKKHRNIVEDVRFRNMYDDSSVLNLSGNDLEFEDRYSFNPMILNDIEFGSVLTSLTQKQTLKIKLSNLSSYRDEDQDYESRMSLHSIEDDDEEEDQRQQLPPEEPIKQQYNLPKKIFSVFTAPIQFLLQLTIPLVSFEQYHTKLQFGFNHLMVFLASIFLCPFVFIHAFVEDPTLTTYLLATIIGLVITFITYQNFISDNQSDLLKLLLSTIGFIGSISWIGMIAEELINVLKFFSVLTHLSDAILGLTIFAIGNSIGDLISNLIIAKLGYPLMALAACFGGPLLNLLLGIGLNGLIVRDHVEIKLGLGLYLSCVWVIINLLFILIWVPMCGWRFDRMTGFIMIGIWCTGTLASVLVELLV